MRRKQGGMFGIVALIMIIGCVILGTMMFVLIAGGPSDDIAGTDLEPAAELTTTVMDSILSVMPVIVFFLAVTVVVIAMLALARYNKRR